MNKPSDNADEAFEKNLEPLRLSKAPRPLYDDTLQAAEQLLAAPGSDQRGRSYVWLAIAAMVLLALGFGIFKSSFWQGEESVPVLKEDTATIAEVSAKDAFRVIETQPGQQAIIAQAFDDFTVSRYETGSQLGHYTLAGVAAETLQLKDNSGHVAEHVVDDWNQQSARQLQQEINYLKTCYMAGQFTVDHFARLEKIAYTGETSALQLVEDVAAADTPLGKKAVQTFGTRQKIYYLRELVAFALDPNSPYREKRIQALKKVQSPITQSALRTIINNNQETDRIRALARRTLTEFKIQKGTADERR